MRVPTRSPRRNRPRIRPSRGIVAYFKADGSGAFVPITKINPEFHDKLKELSTVKVSGVENITSDNNEVIVLKSSSNEYRLKRLAQVFVPPQVLPITKVSDCFDISADESTCEYFGICKSPRHSDRSRSPSPSQYGAASISDRSRRRTRPGHSTDQTSPRGVAPRRKSRVKVRSASNTSKGKAKAGRGMVRSRQSAATKLVNKAKGRGKKKKAKKIGWGKLSDEAKFDFRDQPLQSAGKAFVVSGIARDTFRTEVVSMMRSDPHAFDHTLPEGIRHIKKVGTFNATEIVERQPPIPKTKLNEEQCAESLERYERLRIHYGGVREDTKARYATLKADLAQDRQESMAHKKDGVTDQDFAEISANNFVLKGRTLQELNRIPTALTGEMSRADAAKNTDLLGLFKGVDGPRNEVRKETEPYTGILVPPPPLESKVVPRVRDESFEEIEEDPFLLRLSTDDEIGSASEDEETEDTDASVDEETEDTDASVDEETEDTEAFVDEETEASMDGETEDNGVSVDEETEDTEASVDGETEETDKDESDCTEPCSETDGDQVQSAENSTKDKLPSNHKKAAHKESTGLCDTVEDNKTDCSEVDSDSDQSDNDDDLHGCASAVKITSSRFLPSGSQPDMVMEDFSSRDDNNNREETPVLASDSEVEIIACSVPRKVSAKIPPRLIGSDGDTISTIECSTSNLASDDKVFVIEPIHEKEQPVFIKCEEIDPLIKNIKVEPGLPSKIDDILSSPITVNNVTVKTEPGLSEVEILQNYAKSIDARLSQINSARTQYRKNEIFIDLTGEDSAYSSHALGAEDLLPNPRMQEPNDSQHNQPDLLGLSPPAKRTDRKQTPDSTPLAEEKSVTARSQTPSPKEVRREKSVTARSQTPTPKQVRHEKLVTTRSQTPSPKQVRRKSPRKSPDPPHQCVSPKHLSRKSPSPEPKVTCKTPPPEPQCLTPPPEPRSPTPPPEPRSPTPPPEPRSPTPPPEPRSQTPPKTPPPKKKGRKKIQKSPAAQTPRAKASVHATNGPPPAQTPVKKGKTVQRKITDMPAPTMPAPSAKKRVCMKVPSPVHSKLRSPELPQRGNLVTTPPASSPMPKKRHASQPAPGASGQNTPTGNSSFGGARAKVYGTKKNEPKSYLKSTPAPPRDQTVPYMARTPEQWTNTSRTTWTPPPEDAQPMPRNQQSTDHRSSTPIRNRVPDWVLNSSDSHDLDLNPKKKRSTKPRELFGLSDTSENEEFNSGTSMGKGKSSVVGKNKKKGKHSKDGDKKQSQTKDTNPEKETEGRSEKGSQMSSPSCSVVAEATDNDDEPLLGAAAPPPVERELDRYILEMMQSMMAAMNKMNRTMQTLRNDNDRIVRDNLPDPQAGPYPLDTRPLGHGLTRGRAIDLLRRCHKETVYACKLMRELFTEEERLRDVNVAGKQGREPLGEGGEENPKIQLIYKIVLEAFPGNRGKIPERERKRLMREAMDACNRNLRRRRGIQDAQSQDEDTCDDSTANDDDDNDDSKADKVADQNKKPQI